MSQLEMTSKSEDGLTNWDSVPGLVSTGYQAQNSCAEAVRAGVDTIRVEATEAGGILCKKGGSIDVGGVLFTLKEDVLFTGSVDETPTFVRVVSGGSADEKNLDLFKSPLPVFDPLKGYYTDGSDNRVLNSYVVGGRFSGAVMRLDGYENGAERIAFQSYDLDSPVRVNDRMFFSSHGLEFYDLPDTVYLLYGGPFFFPLEDCTIDRGLDVRALLDSRFVCFTASLQGFNPYNTLIRYDIANNKLESTRNNNVEFWGVCAATSFVYFATGKEGGVSKLYRGEDFDWRPEFVTTVADLRGEARGICVYKNDLYVVTLFGGQFYIDRLNQAGVLLESFPLVIPDVRDVTVINDIFVVTSEGGQHLITPQNVTRFLVPFGNPSGAGRAIRFLNNNSLLSVGVSSDTSLWYFDKVNRRLAELK